MGLFGGKDGTSGRFLLVDPNDGARKLEVKPAGVMVRPDQKIVVETPGAGGYGHPEDRSPDALAVDHDSGKFTDDYLRAHYGGVPKAGE